MIMPKIYIEIFVKRGRGWGPNLIQLRTREKCLN